MALGKRIEAERTGLGWTQQKLVDLVNQHLRAEDERGLTQQALDRLEKRDSNKSEFAIRIADALGVSIRWLLDGVGERRPSSSNEPVRLHDGHTDPAKNGAEAGGVFDGLNAAGQALLGDVISVVRRRLLESGEQIIRGDESWLNDTLTQAEQAEAQSEKSTPTKPGKGRK